MIMSSGAISAYSASFVAMMAVLVPAISSTSLSLILAENEILNWAGWLVLGGACLGMVVGKNLSRYILHSLNLSVQNSLLAEELALKVAKLEVAQADLLKNEALRRERSEHEAANQAKSILLANASHEIRTPLAAINGFADMILTSPKLDPDLRDDLKMVLRNGKYLVSLVNDLIDLSKLESDQIYIEKAVIDPLNETKEVIALLLPQFSAKGLKLEFSYEGQLPKRIETDPTRLREILINLLTNAYKFTDEGVIKVVARFSHDSNSITFSVSDTGIGIDPRVAKLLFQPFSRGESLRVQRTEGSGLGLALSKRLAKLLGGDLVILQDPANRGTTFELTIDAGHPNEATTPRSQRTQRLDSAPQGQGLLTGRKILVVDDAPDLQVLMKRFLEKQGADIEIRSNGQEALDSTLDGIYDLILMDIKMPVMDGYAAANFIRKNGYKLPMIAVTAHASADDRQRCYQNGFDAYISKPVDFEHLVDDLAKHLVT
ncbi:MAG: response regulator [Proteobacteria bacterium]|nr:MAG: response regulator [Pseudomonadota bacterium]